MEKERDYDNSIQESMRNVCCTNLRIMNLYLKGQKAFEKYVIPTSREIPSSKITINKK